MAPFAWRRSSRRLLSLPIHWRFRYYSRDERRQRSCGDPPARRDPDCGCRRLHAADGARRHRDILPAAQHSRRGRRSCNCVARWPNRHDGRRRIDGRVRKRIVCTSGRGPDPARNAGTECRRARGRPRAEYRIGINLGDVMVDGSDLAGDGINVASRLEALCEPGVICVSGSVREQVHGTLDVDFEDIGEQQVKNIARPIRAFAVRLGGADSAASTGVAPSPRKKLATPSMAHCRNRGVCRQSQSAVVLLMQKTVKSPLAAPAPPAFSMAILPLSAPSGSSARRANCRPAHPGSHDRPRSLAIGHGGVPRFGSDVQGQGRRRAHCWPRLECPACGRGRGGPRRRQDRRDATRHRYGDGSAGMERPDGVRFSATRG